MCDAILSLYDRAEIKIRSVYGFPTDPIFPPTLNLFWSQTLNRIVIQSYITFNNNNILTYLPSLFFHHETVNQPFFLFLSFWPCLPLVTNMWSS